jgi:nucleotide-binding universal stress UspA family protein
VHLQLVDVRGIFDLKLLGTGTRGVPTGAVVRLLARGKSLALAGLLQTLTKGMQGSMKLIISATDGSEGGHRAVAFAADLAKSINAKLLIVNVSEDHFSGAELGLLDQLRVTEGDALEELSRRIVSRAKAAAQECGAMNIETMIGAGDPAKVLMEIANREHADAIVVGRHGHGLLEGLLGGVSHKLSNLARCVVMIVP